MADIQVNLLHKEDREEQSHDIAKRIRPGIRKIAKKYGANIKIVEAVSYTHLDVYKRQVLHSSRVRKNHKLTYPWQTSW